MEAESVNQNDSPLNDATLDTSRKAWREIEVKRPHDSQWRVADILRREQD